MRTRFEMWTLRSYKRRTVYGGGDVGGAVIRHVLNTFFSTQTHRAQRGPLFMWVTSRFRHGVKGEGGSNLWENKNNLGRRRTERRKERQELMRPKPTKEWKKEERQEVVSVWNVNLMIKYNHSLTLRSLNPNLYFPTEMDFREMIIWMNFKW